MYLDGDEDHPSLVGTGTEDYIGSGWGQGEYAARYFGSLHADGENDIYAFYRYHIDDPVYFHQNCKVTLQQMGSAGRDELLKIKSKGGDFIPTWAVTEGKDGKRSGAPASTGRSHATKFGRQQFVARLYELLQER